MAKIYIDEKQFIEDAVQEFIQAVDKRRIEDWGEEPPCGEDFDRMINDFQFDPAHMVEVMNAFMEFVKNNYQLR